MHEVDIMGNYFQVEKAVIVCGVLDFFFFFFFPFFLFWQLDFLDQILSWKFIHLSANPGILFAKMTGMTAMGRLHAKTWATVCKSNFCQLLLSHRKVKIPFLPFLMCLRLCCAVKMCWQRHLFILPCNTRSILIR